MELSTYSNHYPHLKRGPIVWSQITDIDGQQLVLEIEALATPIKRGASWRTHRLWKDGQLALGRSYQFSLESALRDARYLEQHTLAAKLGIQNERVQRLEAKLAYYEEQRDKIKYLAERIDDLFTHYPPTYDNSARDPVCSMCDHIEHTNTCPAVDIKEILGFVEELQ